MLRLLAKKAEHRRLRTAVVAATALVVSAAYALSIASTLAVREWNSDDVGMQLMVRTWRPFRSVAHVSDDTFLLKYPFYVVLNGLRPLDRTSVAILSILFHVIGAVLLIVALRRVETPARSRPTVGANTGVVATMGSAVPWAGLLWFASLGPRYFLHQAGPNLRNVESCLALFLLIHAWFRKPSNATFAVLAIGWSLLLVDDPYFGFAFAMPIALVCGAASLWRSGDRQRFRSVGALVAIGTVLWQLDKYLLDRAGLRIVAQRVELVKRHDLGTSLRNTKNTLLAFGGASAPSGGLVQVTLNRLALVGLVVMLGLTAARGTNLARLLCLAAVLPPVAFVVSGRGSNLANGRYPPFHIPGWRGCIRGRSGPLAREAPCRSAPECGGLAELQSAALAEARGSAR